ncbi:immunity 52 family protein [Archangium violaceum]|uniref:immunity 52 family protein n=1 Tax=Archangium violaceum TaxID=83451 RepID=UPI0035E3DF4A
MPETLQRMETYYAGAYWGPRKESPEECARRMEVMLASLLKSDPSFSRWFKPARSLKESLKRPLEPLHVPLQQWIQGGVTRSDGGLPMKDLGYSVMAWNGERDEYDDSDFHVACGGYSPWVNNACVFKLPSKGPNAERVLTTPVLTALVRSMAIAWEPDWAVAMSHTHRDVVKPLQVERSPYVAWVTYLARHRGTVPPLPAPVHMESVEDKGTLIVLTPEHFTAANSTHVELAQRVRALLDGAGLLQPVTP